MKRDPRAFLSDVIEAGHAIQQAVAGINLDDYSNSRLIRSSVEREFTIIGEALGQLSRADVGLFAQIDQAPQIISFRNKLTHDRGDMDDRFSSFYTEEPFETSCAPCCRKAAAPQEKKPFTGR